MARSGRSRSAPTLGIVTGLVVVLLQALSLSAHSAAGECRDRGARDYRPATGAFFNDPTGTVAEQYRIVSAVVKNINGTPPGEEIRVATLAINAKSVVTALTEAHKCRVRVRVVVPGRAWEEPAVVTLRRVLGTDVSAPSYITRCDGSCTSEGDGGIMHLKSYLFSKVNGVPDVTVYSSSNLTRTQATLRWQDAYQLTRNATVYRSATAFFDQLRQDTDLDFTRLTKSAGYWQYYFPTRQDFHLDVLEQTRCESPSGPTRIDLVASIWKQVAVAERLADLRDAGCEVRVTLNLDRIERPVLQALLDRGVPTRVRSSSDAAGATHSKYIAIRGNHDGYIVSTVYCGSSNVSGFSTHTADNSMIRIVDDEAAYGAYRRNFGRVWEGSRPLSQDDVDAAGEVNARDAEMRD